MSSEAEMERLKRLRVDDPIQWQDIVNTSRALVDAVKENDLEELRSVVANAEEGELLQAFVLQAFVIALKATSLEIVQQLVAWGIPLQDEQLSQALHLVCESVDRDNFGNAWRILKLLVEGNSDGGLDVNHPRSMDGWTPLCIACADACLPLAWKLLEFGADPNVITRANDTPVSLVRKKRPNDSEEQQEARGIISNMLRSYGAQDNARDALHRQKHYTYKPPPRDDDDCRQDSTSMPAAPANKPLTTTSLSTTHTRYTG